jgi:hypothetical protein
MRGSNSLYLAGLLAINLDDVYTVPVRDWRGRVHLAVVLYGPDGPPQLTASRPQHLQLRGVK